MEGISMLPPDLQEKAGIALAALSALLSAAGLLACGIAYIAFFLFLQNATSALAPQLDSAESAIGSAQVLLQSAQSSASAVSAGVYQVSGALAAYSNSTGGLGDSLGGISAIPPFSLDSRIASSASKLKEASVLFSNASSSLNSSAGSLGLAASALEKTAGDLRKAKTDIADARSAVFGAFAMLHVAGIAAALSLAALFSAVLLLSVSFLLRMPGKGGAIAPGAKKES